MFYPGVKITYEFNFKFFLKLYLMTDCFVFEFLSQKRYVFDGKSLGSGTKHISQDLTGPNLTRERSRATKFLCERILSVFGLCKTVYVIVKRVTFQTSVLGPTVAAQPERSVVGPPGHHPHRHGEQQVSLLQVVLIHEPESQVGAFPVGLPTFVGGLSLSLSLTRDKYDGLFDWT